MNRAGIALRRTLVFVILINIHSALLAQSPPIRDLALIHSKIYPSPTDSAITDGTILMRNGLVLAVGSPNDVRIPPNAQIIDCKGKVITAGFWNSHVHLLLPGMLHQEKVSSEQLSSQLSEMLTRWGFTTVFDIASVLKNTDSIRDRITRGTVTGPRILTTGEPFWVEGGTPYYVKDYLLENNIHMPEVKSLDEAENRVDSQIRNAADGIKIFINSLERDTILNMPLPMVKGISSRAHMHGKPVFAHVSTQLGIETALLAGVDIIAHTTPMDGPWPDSLVRQMIAAKVALTPTLTLWIEETKKANLAPEELEKAMQLAAGQLRAFHQLGGRVLFGTDVGYIIQFNTLDEYIWMKKAGLSFREILATLTTNPAKQFHFEKRSGQIKPGFDADLTVLEEDPVKDVSAFSNVLYTIRSGKIIYQNK